MIDQIVRQRRRKNMCIEVGHSGEVIVKAPVWAGRAQIEAFVFESRDWIAKQKRKARAKPSAHSTRQFLEGELFLYLGDYYPLCFDLDAREPLRLMGEFYLSVEDAALARVAFVNWYKRKARETFKERVAYYSRISGYDYQSVKLSSANTRWGSCSSEGHINLTWRLIMAPMSVVDYVIVHELAHTQEMNHSKTFWAHVQKWMPGYKSSKKWLEDFGQLLVV